MFIHRGTPDQHWNWHCRRIVAGCVWVLAAGSADAHDFWLEPDTFTPVVDQPVAISLRFGVGFKGETLPYIEDLIADFSLTDLSGTNPVESVQGNDPAAMINVTPGAQLLGYQSTPQFVELNADKFKTYVEEEGIEYILAERERRGESDSPAREHFIRCAKALIQTGPAGQDIYQQKLGYTLELIPKRDPYSLAQGDFLEFELLYQNRPIEGLQLQAFRKADPDNIQKVRTNSEGRAGVTIDEPGKWLVKAVLIVPVRPKQLVSKDAEPVVWQSFWASYVFELPG